MNITRFTDYSIRVLIYLATDQNRLVTIKGIADTFGISKNHLMKVVHHLSQKNYLKTSRGKFGGIQLALAPKAIPLGELMRDLEGESILIECFGPKNNCLITPACQLKTIFWEAKEAFFDVFDAYTLEDLVKDKNKVALQKLLI